MTTAAQIAGSMLALNASSRTASAASCVQRMQQSRGSGGSRGREAVLVCGTRLGNKTTLTAAELAIRSPRNSFVISLLLLTLLVDLPSLPSHQLSRIVSGLRLHWHLPPTLGLYTNLPSTRTSLNTRHHFTRSQPAQIRHHDFRPPQTPEEDRALQRQLLRSMHSRRHHWYLTILP